MGCNMIDEDLSNCDSEYELNYELRLVTNISTELTTQLQTNVNVSSALRTHLSSIFSDKAHDVDLSFYETAGDSLLLYHWSDTINASQTSYTLHLPMRQYMHLAVANVADNHVVDIQKDTTCHTSVLRQFAGDTIDSHTTGLFTARQGMEVLEGINQTFNVHLYMANCATALVINTQGYATAGPVNVYSTGFATGFNICDSVYQFTEQPPMVRTSSVTTGDSNELAFCSVTFPSREQPSTRMWIETEEPFIAQPGEEALWEFHVYVPQPDGTITKTILRIKEPLRAGQFKIIKAWLDEHGAIVPESPEIGTSVTLDWKEGLVIEN